MPELLRVCVYGALNVLKQTRLYSIVAVAQRQQNVDIRIVHTVNSEGGFIMP